VRFEEARTAQAPAAVRPARLRRGLCTAALLTLAAPGCGDGDEKSHARALAPVRIDKAEFSATVNHPLVPLVSVPVTALAGADGDTKTNGTNRLLKKTSIVDGVRVAVLENKEFEDGKLVEHTLDYFAQRRDGSVWYFGERVENYENGKVDHEGQWLAGKGNAQPGIYMPAKPKAGQVFQQERAPGVAEDRSTVLAAGLTRKTGAGKFRNCIKVKDFSPIDKLTEFKYYCAGVGLVHEDEPHAHSDLVRYTRATR
jgi:hypothetical protein